MKISQMLKREDFYTINEKTLAVYFGEGGAEKSTLYVYPHLNAIVTAKPSKKVTDYLLCEYSVRSNAIKRAAVRLYVMACLHSVGLLSARSLEISYSIGGDIMIYPCNRKYRIFDFGKNLVTVINKVGFSDSALLREIEFRKREGLPSFIPRMVRCDNSGYTETIIDGRPLARVSSGFETYRDQAYQALQAYGSAQKECLAAKAYAKSLLEDIGHLADQKVQNKGDLLEIAERLLAFCTDDTMVTIGFSHGDLQPGNIWVANKTSQIYIIDWESWGKRSVWYDKAVLYQNLRPGGLQQYFSWDVPDTERAIVLLEDLIFQLNELNNLPSDFGHEGFRQYVGLLTAVTRNMGKENEER